LAKRSSFLVLRVAITAVFTALVTVATVTFSVYVPATRRYFNIGETMARTTAADGIAGGIGGVEVD